MWIKDIQDISTKILKAASVGASLSDLVLNLRETDGVVQTVHHGLAFVEDSLEALDIQNKVPFVGSWTRLRHCDSMAAFVVEAANTIYNPTVIVTIKDYDYYTCEVGNTTIGWSMDRYDSIDMLSVDGAAQEGRDAIGMVLWEYYGSSIMISAKNDWSSEIRIERDKLVDARPSKTAQDIAEELEQYLEKGYHRSALIYGPPGTGKSSAMKYIGNLFGGHTVRLPAKSLCSMRKFKQLCDVLKPSVVLVDDIDWIPNQNELLSILEEMSQHAKLVLFSANRIQALNPAILRPGRLDSIYFFDKLDDGVLDDLMGDIPAEARRRLKELPVAYIDEFRKRAEVLGEERAIESIEALHSRCQDISDSLSFTGGRT